MNSPWSLRALNVASTSCGCSPQPSMMLDLVRRAPLSLASCSADSDCCQAALRSRTSPCRRCTCRYSRLEASTASLDGYSEGTSCTTAASQTWPGTSFWNSVPSYLLAAQAVSNWGQPSCSPCQAEGRLATVPGRQASLPAQVSSRSLTPCTLLPAHRLNVVSIDVKSTLGHMLDGFCVPSKVWHQCLHQEPVVGLLL